MENKINKNHTTEKHPKQDFQVERLAFFSDAVFAIAITLLIIEFKVPHVTKDSTFESVWDELLDLRFNLIALLMSFFLIATYWIRHHFLFKHIHNYNKQIIMANMLVLLPIIFFPFTTTFFAESFENKNVILLAGRFFLLNHILAALFIYIFYWFALVKHKNMSYEMTVQEKIKFTSETLFSIIPFTIFFIASLFIKNIEYTSQVSFIAIVLIAILSRKIIELFFKKSLIKKPDH